MAAVYTAKGGRSEPDAGTFPPKNTQAGVKRGVAPLLTNAKMIKVEESSEDENTSLAEQIPTRVRSETATMDAIPAIAIKEESIEDDEYVQIKLVDVEESSEERTENNESDRDNESIDVKLRSMRCQDCGQQFIRWEAFKIHLRQHEHDERELKRKKKKANKTPPHLQQGNKKSQEDRAQDKEKISAGDDDEDSWFSSSWEINPSEVFKVRPRVAMLSEEEKPVYSSSHRVYACSICGKVYSYLESFRNHQKLHASELNEPQLFTCPHCGRKFNRQANLCIHMKVHNTEKVASLKCDQCNKVFNSQQTWLSHKDIHRRKPFWCLSCAKGFKDSRGLDRHLLGHDLKRHKCDLCPKTFRVPAELRYHRNTHTGAKPYTCNLCKKTFSQLGNLITHRKKHVGVYKVGSETPIGGKPVSGARRVTELKKLIVMSMGDPVEMGMTGDRVEPQEERDVEEESESSSSSSSSSEDEEGEELEDDEEEEYEEMQDEITVVEVKSVEPAEEELECFECGSRFGQESELHLHYMKHASGEL